MGTLGAHLELRIASRPAICQSLNVVKNLIKINFRELLPDSVLDVGRTIEAFVLSVQVRDELHGNFISSFCEGIDRFDGNTFTSAFFDDLRDGDILIVTVDLHLD